MSYAQAHQELFEDIWSSALEDLYYKAHVAGAHVDVITRWKPKCKKIFDSLCTDRRSSTTMKGNLAKPFCEGYFSGRFSLHLEKAMIPNQILDLQDYLSVMGG